MLIILTDGRRTITTTVTLVTPRRRSRSSDRSENERHHTICITIDRESEAELRDLYGDVGYTIIDDVLSLPERMPNIYRRLTT